MLLMSLILRKDHYRYCYHNRYIIIFGFIDFFSLNSNILLNITRAPVLVAIALIEAGMSPLDSVAFIREKRRGVINNKQLKYIESYKRRPKSAKCIIC